MTLRRATLSLLAAAAVLDGCACEKLPSNALTDCRQGAVVQGAVKTDILFVVDDSGSMGPHQTNLSSNLSSFINTLKSSPVANDFQIGVTTTSVSDFGSMALVGEQGCFVGPILQGSDPSLVTKFQAQVAVGTGGSGKEQPLRAMKLALTTPSLAGCTNNAGFLRPDARLAVVILTDEDDNSESTTNVANTNDKTHNDVQTGGAAAGQGVDFKGTVEDPVSDYVTFLGGLGRDVVIGVIAGVDPATKAPTTDYAVGNHWGCGSPVNNVCVANTAGSNVVVNPLAAPNQTMDVWCRGAATGTTCASTCPNAYDKADRLMTFVSPSNFASDKVVVGSICDASFATTLAQIAGLIISPTVPLQGAPADPAMLVVRIDKPDGTTVVCKAGTDYTYAAPLGSRPATVTFLDSGACKLDQGYQIRISVICAG